MCFGARRLCEWQIDYRCNRAVLFASDQYHESLPFTFAAGYANRRVNLTFLYGDRWRQDESLPAAEPPSTVAEGHRDQRQRQPPPKSDAVAGRGEGWGQGHQGGVNLGAGDVAVIEGWDVFD